MAKNLLLISKLHGTQLYVHKFMMDRAATTPQAGTYWKLDFRCVSAPLVKYAVRDSFRHVYVRPALFPSKQSTSRQTAPTNFGPCRVECDLEHMSSPVAWENLSSKCALKWWLQWGVETTELQELAKNIVSLMVGSGSAERTWKDLGNVCVD